MSTGISRGVPFMNLARHHGPVEDELRAAFERVLGASAFILGSEVENFETEFAAYCGTDYCIGVNSGTAALTIMLQAAGIGRGDEVIVPAHTFIASALSVLHAGATPVCVDVERGTGLIDPAAARAALSESTAAILAVHLYGQVCDMAGLRELAASKGLALFEDAAQSHGATFQGQRAGGLGDASAFSFYPSKNLGALGDGGAICTSDPAWAERARRFRDLGRSSDPNHEVAGYNERLDGMQAAFLSAKLPYLDGWNAARRSVAAVYRQSLPGSIELLEEKPESPCIYHLFPVRVDDRAELAAELGARGIATGVHYPLALVDQPPLQGQARSTEAPNARDWAARELSLPIFPELAEAEVAEVIAAVGEGLSGKEPSL